MSRPAAERAKSVAAAGRREQKGRSAPLLARHAAAGLLPVQSSCWQQTHPAPCAQGPTKDNRIKPDLVAPGTLYSAKRLVSSSSDQCGVTGMQARRGAAGQAGRLGGWPASRGSFARGE